MKNTLVRYFLFIFILFLGSSERIFAQQGFGTKEPSKASVVDMQSENRGLLIPRVALTSLTTFLPNTGENPSDATSASKTNALLVYNTATAGVAPNNVTPGYYYWTSANQQWNRLFIEADVLTVEPWYNQATNTPATSNTQDIYQMGAVAVGKNTVYTGATLDVAGAVRGGANHLGTVGTNSVAFGNSNTASGISSAVSGGNSNIASGSQSVVSGGLLNIASSQFSVVSGGYENEASQLVSTVSGGATNTASGEYSVVSGGWQNTASANRSVVSGGYLNSAAGLNSTVSGGQNNEASGGHSTVSGGQSNDALGTHSTVSGGHNNEASGDWSTVSGGIGNRAQGNYSTVSGAYNIASSSYEWVGGVYSTVYAATGTETDRLFNIGRGASPAIQRDAFTILKDGRTGVGFSGFRTVTFPQLFQVNGSVRITELYDEAGDIDEDKIVVVDADGVLATLEISNITTTAKNGLTKTANNIQLGGQLEDDTVIDLNGNTLAIEELPAGSSTDSMVVADPTTGVLKKKRAPTMLFYMPPVIFDTTSTGNNLTRDLHQDYVDLFEGNTLYMARGAGAPSMEYTGGLIKSSGAPDIPIYEADELWFYVVYYDTTVFAGPSGTGKPTIDANGVLSYSIIGTATEASYMTIAFSVRD